MESNGFDQLQCEKNAPRLITAEVLASWMQISKRTLQRYLLTGKVLRPMRIGRGLRWRVDEVRKWIDSGCPSMLDWERKGAK
jgi:predicted DNA-binding transcriptional regulator AlpA